MATKLVFCGKKVNLPAVREQAFYLTTDTHEVYFGQNLYTEPVRFVPERETTPAQGVLYILPSGLGEVYDGSAWKTVIKPTVTTIEAGVTDEQIATAKAVKDYVDNLVTGGIGALGALAKKDEVTEIELGDDLKKKINDAAAQASTLVGEDASKSARAIAAEEVAKIVDGADASFDTLKEIADWILSDTTGAAKMANDITRLDGILAGIGGTDEEATVVAYVTKMINALGIGDYVKTTTMTTELGKKVDKVEGSRLMTNAEGTKLAGIAAGAQANVIEKIKVNGVEATPAAEDKSIALTIPTGKLAGKDIVAETDLDATLKEKVNAAAEGNHSHANKAFLDTLSGATDEEVTAMCTEVFGA